MKTSLFANGILLAMSLTFPMFTNADSKALDEPIVAPMPHVQFAPVKVARLRLP